MLRIAKLIVVLFVLPNALGIASASEAPVMIDVVSRVSAESSLYSSHSVSLEDIQRMNPASVTNLLRSMPGISVFEASGNERLSYISIRGGESNFTLILIDGIRVNDPTNSRGGGFDFSQLDIAVVDSVEVYTGDISAIYGGAAMNGVISITTLRGNASSLSFEAGNESSYQANVFKSFAANGQSGLVSISASDAGDLYTGFTENTQAMGKYQLSRNEIDFTVVTSYSETSSSAFPEDSGGAEFSSLAGLDEVSSDLLLSGITLRASLNSELSWNNTVNWARHREFTVSPGIVGGVIDGIPPSQIDSTYKSWVVDSFIEHLSDTSKTIVGLSYEQAKGANEGFLDFGFQLPASFELNQNVASGFAEFSSTIGSLEIGVGARYDKPENFQSQTSIRANAAYVMTPTLSVKGSWSEGYKLPSFFALAHPLVGNAALKPEESVSRSFGIYYLKENGNIAASVEYFSNRYLELVDFDPVQFTSINRGEVVAKGMNASAGIQFDNSLRIDFTSNYTDVDVISSQDVLRRRPNFDIGLSTSYSITSSIVGHLNFHRTNEFFDSSIPTGLIQLPAYNRIDLNLSKTFQNQIKVRVALDNVADKRYQHSIGFRDYGMQARIGISVPL